MTDYYDRNGYDVEITIGDQVLSTDLSRFNNGLCDTLTITTTTNTARLAVFSFYPPHGFVDFEDYQGQEVNILMCDGDQNWLQVFNGAVDTPSIDLLTGKITITCSDDRNNRVVQLPSDVITSVGTYSAAVFGIPTDAADELSKRIQTIPATFDFDNYGNWRVTPWLPKDTPDYSYTNIDISNLKIPTVTATNRKKTINQIDINISYTFQRLHQQTVNVSWSGFSDFLTDWLGQGSPSFPTITTIDAASKGSNWKVTNATGVQYVPLWPAQGFTQGAGTIIWQPNTVTNTYKGKTQFMGFLTDPTTGEPIVASGNSGLPATFVPYFAPVLDSNGKQVQEVVSSTITDTSSMLCRGASWVAALRFAQSVKEQYTISLYSSQAQQILGVVPTTATVSMTAAYDATEWEKSDKVLFSPEPFYIDKKDNYSDLQEAIQVSLNKAQHDILDVYRDVTVDFDFRESHLHPELDITHTIELSVDASIRGLPNAIHSIGRVDAIVRKINFGTYEAITSVTMRLSRIQGTTTSTAWDIPIPVDDSSYIGNTQSIGLPSHIGENPDPTVTPGAEKWTGWICNHNPSINGTLQNRTKFPESFIVDYPAIPDILRNLRTITSNSSFDINIPNDILEIIT